ncbi:hypothetical protein N7478_003066 [Penicillium angulare]|uniref:uncharacterized protein n=1 Tax=Penicillium angulare TaxID=116970 RepID=UPI002541E0B7|nr:uncharacterized protein N7478_003066 [Penicillium angulare]KAJ5287380.1 hypothetical protein N7478_003066 [Penicillium angulare]
MTPHQRRNRSPETPQVQTRASARPSPPATSKISKKTPSARTTPHSSGWTHPRPKGSRFDPRAQSTLTQIDFVTQTPHPDDEKLDYLDDTESRDDINNEPVVQKEASDDDGDHRQSSRTRPAHSTFETNNDHPKRRRKSTDVNNGTMERGQSIRKSQTPRASVGPKSKRKPTEKPTTKRDKTLTQMNFVRRYITIDDDDVNDPNLSYIEPTPKKLPAGKTFKSPQSAKLKFESQTTPSSVKLNRRISEAELDLSTGEPISDPGISQAADNDSLPQRIMNANGPITPRKRRLEIPSSQSPESPGLAIITSSQFRDETGSPLKRKSPNLANSLGNQIKEEAPKPQRLVDDSHDQDHTSPNRTPTENWPKVVVGSSQRQRTFKERLVSSGSHDESRRQKPTPTEHEPTRTQGDRTVVYETDAESDQSDTESQSHHAPPTPSRVQESQVEDTHNCSPTPSLGGDDSQELPLPPSAQSPSNLDDCPPSEPPMSDASIYYQRLQPATQFPHEPIPMLSTQKLSELFPNEGNTQHIQSRVEGTRDTRAQRFTGPFLQTQTQSQDYEEPEIVPESSPAREQNDSIEENQAEFHRPPVREPIVQIESSQPVERANARNGILSRSQLLTSSVMESVPLPNFWMGSQDSVGEPYSLPDR